MAKIMLKQTSDFLNGKGIISVITRNHDVPWKNLVNPLDLDLDYYLNKSGSKVITPLLENFITNKGISDENMNRIASLCYTKYGLGWQRAWDALQEEYNAIHNYDGTETITETETIQDNSTDNRTLNNTSNTTGSNTGTVGTTSNSTNNSTGTEVTDNDIYGFNSSNDSPAGKTTRTPNLTDSTQGNSTTTNNLANTENVTEQGTDNNTHNGTTTRNHTTSTTRGGNLGTTMTQDMLTAEMQFRADYNFYETIVFPNIDEVLVLSIFADCETDLDDLHIESSYTLPVASPLILGGVKIGNNIHITDDGTITADIDLSGILESIESLTEDTNNNKMSINSLTEDTNNNTMSINSLAISKQDNLVSGTNIKTINGESILGSGNIDIKGDGGGGVTVQINDVVQSLQLTPVVSVEVEVQ